MKDFTAIKQKCDETSAVASKLIDEYLIYYAASRNNLEKTMEQDFAKYRHITRSFQDEWTNRMKAQYIAHKIFRKDGLINKFLGHDALKRLNYEQLSFLRFQADHPWKFSFSVIIENPAENFYVMEDVFSSEEYLLYSPGIRETLKDTNPLLWFNTVAFNGECWQSYGLISCYQSFMPDDIFFFATEIDPAISDEEELLKHIEDNPVPYMMLITGSAMPNIVHNEDLLVHAVAEYEPATFDHNVFLNDFDSEQVNGVYRLSLKNWNGPPHHSVVYYDEENNNLMLSAMTDKGYEALTRKLMDLGFDISPEPFIRVGLTMLSTASDILKRKIDLVPYENLFIKESSPQQKESLDRINKVIAMIIPEINAGRKPDPGKLAELTGTDLITVKDIIDQLSRKKK